MWGGVAVGSGPYSIHQGWVSVLVPVHTVHTVSKAHVKATTVSYMRLPVLPVSRRNVGP